MSARIDRIKEAIRRAALELGFVAAGFTSAAPLPHGPFYRRWLAAGHAANMDYLDRPGTARDDPRSLLDGAKTVIVVNARYHGAPAQPAPPGHGKIARYARGPDYHPILRRLLRRLADAVSQIASQPIRSRPTVDTAPLLEREAAMRAGLGFIGKNTLLIRPGVGSYTVLGALLIDLALPADPPAVARCGRCTRCIDACPTGAIVAPYTLDARRCISYLTIEHRQGIDAALAENLDGWLFGCDRCQEACPFNHPSFSGPPLPELHVDNAIASLEIEPLLHLRSGAYRRMVKGRAFARLPRRAWRRNALLLAGKAAHRSMQGSADPKSKAGEGARGAS